MKTAFSFSILLSHGLASVSADFADQIPPLPQHNDVPGTVNGCAAAIMAHDDDGDGAIRRDEYLGFVNTVADLLCSPPRPILDLELQTVFVSIACLCQEREDNDSSCCFGEQAGLFLDGADSAMGRTKDEESYLRAACLLTQAILGPDQCHHPPATLTLGAWEPMDDPNWPGFVPSDMTSAFALNIQFDNFPNELNWVLSQQKVVEHEMIADEYEDGTTVSSLSRSNSTYPVEDQWIVVDQYLGEQDYTMEQIGGFETHIFANLTSETLYRLTINDTGGDGFCCDHGMGWMTITADSGAEEGEAVLWGIMGDVIMVSSTVVKLWVDEHGMVALEDSPPVIFNETYAITTTSITEENLLWPASIPSEIGLLTALTSLNVDSTSNLQGTLPTELGKLTGLKSLHVTATQVTGTIPTQLGLTGLEYIDISYNSLTGTIPTELGLLTELTTLRLNSNNLSGQISSELGLLTLLDELYLTANVLTGKVPLAVCALTRDYVLPTMYLDEEEVTCPASCSCV